MGEHYLGASNLVCGPLLEEEMSPSKEEEEESQGMGGAPALGSPSMEVRMTREWS